MGSIGKPKRRIHTPTPAERPQPPVVEPTPEPVKQPEPVKVPA